MSKPGRSKFLDKYWMENYVNHDKPFGLCSLCGNTGIIDMTETAISPTGIKVGRKNFCICPNGQMMRYEDKIRKGCQKAIDGRNENCASE